MKKFILSLIFIAALSFTATITNAQEMEKTENKPRTGYVDADGDGICDNYDGVRPGKGIGPGHGYGEGRTTGKRLFRRQNFRAAKNFDNRTYDRRALRRGNGRGLQNEDGENMGVRQRLRDGSGPYCPSPETDNLKNE